MHFGSHKYDHNNVIMHAIDQFGSTIIKVSHMIDIVAHLLDDPFPIFIRKQADRHEAISLLR